MKRELGVRQLVGIPVTMAWSPRDVDVSIDMMEPKLCAVELSGFPAPCGDVDRTVACKGVLYPFVHQHSPVEMTSVSCHGGAGNAGTRRWLCRHVGGGVEARHPQRSLKGPGLLAEEYKDCGKGCTRGSGSGEKSGRQVLIDMINK
jgi:hypothetical protein